MKNPMNVRNREKHLQTVLSWLLIREVILERNYVSNVGKLSDRGHILSIMRKFIPEGTLVSVNNVGEHKRVHTGKKPSKCAGWRKAFANTSTHAQHHRLYMRVKPYVCVKCGKAFRTNTYFNCH